MPSAYKGISKAAKTLLRSGENKRADYKERVKGLHAEDLVAFANSELGGTILIGVREKIVAGRQTGEPIGHPIDDETRLQILAKALSCSPPVQIEIILENIGAKPFYRIEVPTGAHKPYATNSGTYKIREDGRNNPLLPEQLLKMFLEREGEEFGKRFVEATLRLDNQVAGAIESVNRLEQTISSKIEDIGNNLGWAEFKTNETADTMDTVLSHVSALSDESKRQTQRLRAIGRKVAADDPIRRDAEQKFKKAVFNELEKSPELLQAASEGKNLQMSLSGELTSELEPDDLQRLFTEAVKELLKRETE